MKSFQSPNDESLLLDCLRISFDSLSPVRKEMFLDVACMLQGKDARLL